MFEDSVRYQCNRDTEGIPDRLGVDAGEPLLASYLLDLTVFDARKQS
jgi:hypothetical protein